MNSLHRVKSMYKLAFIAMVLGSIFVNSIEANGLLKTWPDELISYCGRFCANGELIIVSEKICPFPLCFPCDCDPRCALTGTCCLSNDTINSTNTTKGDNYLQTYISKEVSWYKLVSCQPIRFINRRSYMVINKCIRSKVVDEETRNRCENVMNIPIDRNISSLDLFKPVTDKSTRIVYPNIYCAMCNGVYYIGAKTRVDRNEDDNEGIVSDNSDIPEERSKFTKKNNETLMNSTVRVNDENKIINSDLIQWRLDVRCFTYQNIYHVDNEKEYFIAAHFDEDCKVVTFKPTGHEIECPIFFSSVYGNFKTTSSSTILTTPSTTPLPTTRIQSSTFPNDFTEIVDTTSFMDFETSVGFSPKRSNSISKDEEDIFPLMEVETFVTLSLVMSEPSNDIKHAGILNNLNTPEISKATNNENVLHIDLDSYLSNLRQLCSNLPPILALRVGHYRNLFCVLVQGKPIDRTFPCPGDLGDDYILPPIYFLFGTDSKVPNEKPNVDSVVKTCPKSYWKNDQDTCIQASCSPGKLLHSSNMACKSFLAISELKYSFHAVYVYRQHHFTDAAFTSFKNKINDKLSEVSNVNSLVFNIRNTSCISQNNANYQTSQTNEKNGLAIMQIKGLMNGAMNTSRDIVEEFILDYFASQNAYVVCDTPADQIQNINNKSTIVTDGHEIFKGLGNANGDEGKIRLLCIGSDLCELFFEKYNEIRNKSSYNNINNQTEVCEDPKLSNLVDFSYSGDNRIDITPGLSCPYITLNETVDISNVYIREGKVNVEITLRNQTIAIKDNDFSGISIDDNQINVCLWLLKRISNDIDNALFRKKSTSDIIVTINYYLDIVCIAVSCGCLAAVIMTYCLFPSLRSLPGLNNMALSLCLITAQVSLLVSSIPGARGKLPRNYCFANGVILHASWIASFAWMSVCCIHMFRVFTGRNFGNELKKFAIYCSTVFAITSLVVCATMSISYTLTSGESLGYNERSCFLDLSTSKLVMILGFLAPQCVALVCNTTLFVMTVKEIVSVRKLQSESRNHQGVMTYVKLSTVTGVFCFVVAAAAQVQSPVLSLLISPLAGLQGAFIFFSFIVNKRVIDLYKKLWLGRDVEYSEKTGTTSMTKSN